MSSLVRLRRMPLACTFPEGTLCLPKEVHLSGWKPMIKSLVQNKINIEYKKQETYLQQMTLLQESAISTKSLLTSDDKAYFKV